MKSLAFMDIQRNLCTPTIKYTLKSLHYGLVALPNKIQLNKIFPQKLTFWCTLVH